METTLKILISTLALLPIITGCKVSPPRGTERGPCLNGNQCNEGLVCGSGLCVKMRNSIPKKNRIDVSRARHEVLNPNDGLDEVLLTSEYSKYKDKTTYLLQCNFKKMKQLKPCLSVETAVHGKKGTPLSVYSINLHLLVPSIILGWQSCPMIKIIIDDGNKRIEKCWTSTNIVHFPQKDNVQALAKRTYYYSMYSTDYKCKKTERSSLSGMASFNYTPPEHLYGEKYYKTDFPFFKKAQS